MVTSVSNFYRKNFDIRCIPLFKILLLGQNNKAAKPSMEEGYFVHTIQKGLHDMMIKSYLKIGI